ncbi:MAG: 23S rRNA (adenine(2503)-C(2))-methyltransferase RlmN, partial [Candidatus Izemoplasmatales bacterium]|nr:23S rRNA (adenine(2503)-C(2))-methyltransferase RlmN [Candidatus Izemoplasmatales bacterium]
MPEKPQNVISNLTRVELENHLIEHGFKRYNASQIFEWFYQKGEEDFSKMSNISFALRAYLQQFFRVFIPQIAKEQASADGTHKYLLRLED